MSLSAIIMPEAELDAKVRPWGNSMGIIIPAGVARSLNLKAGDTVHLKLEHTRDKNNVDRFPKWDFVVDISDADMDRIVDEELEKEHGV